MQIAVFLGLSRDEKLVVTAEKNAKDLRKPLTTLQTASIMRTILGEELTSQERNSLNAKCLYEHAKTVEVSCAMPPLVALCKLPTPLYVLVHEMIDKFNDGRIKIDSAKERETKHAAYFRGDERDFKNLRFLIDTHRSYYRSPNATQTIIDDLTEGRICVAVATERISKTERSLFDQCRTKKNEKNLNDAQIAELAYPNDNQALEKTMRNVTKLKEQKFNLGQHFVSGLIKKLKEMDCNNKIVQLGSISELSIIPDLIITSDSEEIIARILSRCGELGGHGNSILLVTNLVTEMPNTIRIHTVNLNTDDFNNGNSHLIGALTRGSKELMAIEGLNDELASRGIDLLKYMPHTIETFKLIAKGSNAILTIGVKDPCIKNMTPNIMLCIE